MISTIVKRVGRFDVNRRQPVPDFRGSRSRSLLDLKNCGDAGPALR